MRMACRPYGTEAMHVLRAEKGYIVIGQETDGTVIPADLGLDWTIARDKAGFRRQAFADATGHAAADRKQRSACLSADRSRQVHRWRMIRHADMPIVSLGHVTSAYWSEALESPLRWR